MALAYYRDRLCPCGCGHDIAEAHDPDNEGRYQVGPPDRCQVRTALTLAAEPYRESPQPEALLFSAELKR